MSEKKSNKNPKARLFTANFSTALSIALVLFIVAFIGLFSFHVWVLSNEIKENVSFTIYMTTDATEQDGLNLQKQVAKNPVVKNVEYHSLEEVTQMMNKDFGEITWMY